MDTDEVVRLRAEVAALKAENEAERERADALQAGLKSALDDLAALLRALGESDAARPETPHAVMLGCIAKVAALRRVLDNIERRLGEGIAPGQPWGNERMALQIVREERARPAEEPKP